MKGVVQCALIAVILSVIEMANNEITTSSQNSENKKQAEIVLREMKKREKTMKSTKTVSVNQHGKVTIREKFTQ